MALTVEDNTGLVAADSYISVTDATAYFTLHASPAAWTAATTAEKESALRYAAQWLDSNFAWPGQLFNQEGPQALAWPRFWAWDREGRQLDGVPQAIKDSQCEMALQHLSSALNVVYTGTDYIKSQTVGPVSRTFQDNAPVGRQYRFIRNLLAAIIGSSSSAVIPLARS